MLGLKPSRSSLSELCPLVLGLKLRVSNDVAVQLLWASPLKWQGSTADEITVSRCCSGSGLWWVSGRLRAGREHFSWQLKHALKMQLY